MTDIKRQEAIREIKKAREIYIKRFKATKLSDTKGVLIGRAQGLEEALKILEAKE